MVVKYCQIHVSKLLGSSSRRNFKCGVIQSRKAATLTVAPETQFKIKTDAITNENNHNVVVNGGTWSCVW